MKEKVHLSFKEDKLEFEIQLDGSYIGYIKIDVWTHKWFIKPSFKLPYNFVDVTKKRYESSYEAGKEMTKLYNFLYPPVEEVQKTQEPGISLDDMLTFLKERK